MFGNALVGRLVGSFAEGFPVATLDDGLGRGIVDIELLSRLHKGMGYRNDGGPLVHHGEKALF